MRIFVWSEAFGYRRRDRVARDKIIIREKQNKKKKTAKQSNRIRSENSSLRLNLKTRLLVEELWRRCLRTPSGRACCRTCVFVSVLNGTANRNTIHVYHRVRTRQKRYTKRPLYAEVSIDFRSVWQHFRRRFFETHHDDILAIRTDSTTRRGDTEWKRLVYRRH